MIDASDYIIIELWLQSVRWYARHAQMVILSWLIVERRRPCVAVYELLSISTDKTYIHQAIEYRAHFGQGEKCTDHGVVYGNRQMLDIDYDESFTPVASEIAPKMFMTNVAIKNHRWEQWDIVYNYLRAQFRRQKRLYEVTYWVSWTTTSANLPTEDGPIRTPAGGPLLAPHLWWKQQEIEFIYLPEEGAFVLSMQGKQLKLTATYITATCRRHVKSQTISKCETHWLSVPDHMTRWLNRSGHWIYNPASESQILHERKGTTKWAVAERHYKTNMYAVVGLLDYHYTTGPTRWLSALHLVSYSPTHVSNIDDINHSQNSVKGLYIRIREHHHTKVSLNDGDGSAIELDTGDLEWLMRGAPKMRAILPIIRDQVFLKQEK